MNVLMMRTSPDGAEVHSKYPLSVLVKVNLAQYLFSPPPSFWRTTKKTSLQLSQSLRVSVLSATTKCYRIFQLFQIVAIFFENNFLNCPSIRQPSVAVN